MRSFHAGGPVGVKSAVWKVGQLLSLYPDKRTISALAAEICYLITSSALALDICVAGE
ncbi:bsr4178 [Bradyrhizobium diazoefficiens USDA 110]|uniref:Bsr4178 protein n=1 Tax=Bradyrhizobium diazoefficiens (strain JCM 10833 / BCRC 13528 / IAM 13628 / NBRC 14792 / USDA 110) TaxID=224911 RepID=Q89ML5_BRADU|nr:hypothetical protein Bdiaspc4_21650 [Bradyrhizobium diazoefficiens]QHP70781.1 hypothetical protein EI171_27950 [Bradyrhizobium sp. LCT2]BAC49443.1 bsr4178 [Bradyrhizobium diazoefficiens USDA 110]